jgi:MscS family membrane protein
MLGIISLIRDYNIRRLQRTGQESFAALLGPITKMVKVVVVLIIALVWAEDAGYNMTTILAGLGVGSLAVALAAQKTLENLIGAITLYSARPIAPGDFCRFGTVTGTVEEIGLRSTAIRTLDRTLVHVPNAVLSAVEIENFSARDRIRYFRNLRVLAESPGQLRVILAEIRRTLLAHPMVRQDTVSVRLDNIDDAVARLRIDAGIPTTDYQEFLAVAEDLNLRFIDIVAEAGAALVGPGQLRVVRDAGDAGRASANVDEMLALWREQDATPFPDFSDEEKAELRGSLEYPGRT